MYKEITGTSNTITFDQMLQAEGRMIIYELTKITDYNNIYDTWTSNNPDGLYTKEAAYDAGYIICIEYERPDEKYVKAPKRGKTAELFFYVMVG